MAGDNHNSHIRVIQSIIPIRFKKRIGETHRGAKTFRRTGVKQKSVLARNFIEPVVPLMFRRRPAVFRRLRRSARYPGRHCCAGGRHSGAEMRQKRTSSNHLVPP